MVPSRNYWHNVPQYETLKRGPLMTHTQWYAAGAVVSVLATTLAAQSGPTYTARDYADAAGVIESNTVGLVRNESVEPHWLGLTGDFWYRRDEADGTSYVRFAARTGRKAPLFDHVALAAALGKVLGPANPPTANHLGLSGVALSGDGKRLTATVGARTVTCELVPASCQAADGKRPDPGLLLSPDGTHAAFIKADNLYIRDLVSGRETQITTDGAPQFSYGALSEMSLITIPRRKFGMVLPPMGTSWSPDGKYLIVPRVDERQVPFNNFVEWVPQDGSRRPILHQVRSAFTGDREQLVTDLFIIEPASGRRVPVTLPAAYAAGGSQGLSSEPVGWSVARHQAFLIGRAPGGKALALLRVDLATGAAALVVEEKATVSRVETNTEEYNVPNIRVIDDGAAVIWYSARSGAGQLYRYDGQTGAQLNGISGTAGAVFNIIAVDEKKREIFFTAGGREAGRDPYYQHLYQAGLDKGDPRLLTPTDADHQFDPPRSALLKLLFRVSDPPVVVNLPGGVFLDTYSTVDTPPVTVLRSTTDGRQLAEVERADPSALFATGWRAPVREQVIAADGTTPIYAVYYAPLRDIGRPTHPVIDAEYGGPQVMVAPRNFPQAYGAGNPRGESGLARLGFAMVTVDGRGTPYRDNAFRDAGYPEFTQVGIDDHIAAIRQLATRHSEMDTTRVGVYGWSWGGTFAAQAILSRPDFYRVAVSGAGVYDYAALYPGFESVTGLPVYADGSANRGKPDEAPASWRKLDITAMAPNLKGHLLLIYGDLDENVPSLQAFRLAAALVKANKPYDLIYLPGRTHAGGGEGYPIKRTWDYFLTHLMNSEPVSDAVVAIKPPAPR